MSEGSLQRQPVLLRRVDDGVAQALDVVAGHHELDGREERADEVRLLVADGLADAFRDGDLERFSSSVAEGDAVDVQHDVGALGVLAEHRDFLGHREVVGLRVLPVDQPDRLVLLADAGLDLHAVAQQARRRRGSPRTGHGRHRARQPSCSLSIALLIRLSS